MACKVHVDDLVVIQPDTAGIDIGSQSHWVSVPADRDTEPVREFSAMTHGLLALADWLQQCGIRRVAMESTGVYWIPLYELLCERGFEVALVDGRKIKHVSGRKSDPIDCRWLRKLHSCGLLQGAFRPEQEVCELRAIVRHRGRLIEDAARYVQRMQKALTEMNLKLDRVLSDIAGTTGMAIIRAIVAGERDPALLAQHRDKRCQRSVEEITQALTGTWRDEHLYVLAQALSTYDHFHAQVRACDAEIERRLAQWPTRTDAPAPAASKRKRQRNTPQIDLHTALYHILGVDVAGMPGMDPYTVLRVLSEVGTTLERFESVKAFAAWLGLCPGTRISGGKVLCGKTARIANRAARAFRLAAQAVGKTDTALGAFYRRLKARLGAPKALTATAHKMARQFYALIKHGEGYVEQGAAEYEARYKQRVLNNLSRRAKALGFNLVPTAA